MKFQWYNNNDKNNKIFPSTSFTSWWENDIGKLLKINTEYVGLLRCGISFWVFNSISHKRVQLANKWAIAYQLNTL